MQIMDSDEDEPNYYINMHVGGKLVRDPHLRYDSRTLIRILEDPDTMSYFELCNIVKKREAFFPYIIECELLYS